MCPAAAAGPAIDHFQQVETKESPIFWEPLVFAIGIAEAWRIGVGWAPPRSENFNQLLVSFNPLPVVIAWQLHLCVRSVLLGVAEVCKIVGVSLSCNDNVVRGK